MAIIFLCYLIEFYKFGANYVSVVEVRPILLRQKFSSKKIVFGNTCCMVIFLEITAKRALKKGTATV